jgi:hypothetical protein
MGNKQLVMVVTGAAILMGAAAMAFINRWLEKTSKRMESERLTGPDIPAGQTF